jgi:hypothetical protein
MRSSDISTDTIVDDLGPERISRFIDERQLIKRAGTVDDLIGVVQLLCATGGSFITGDTVVVGGGFARRL